MSLPPLEGDLGGVTGAFKVLSQEPTVLNRGANDVVDAMKITVQDKVYGVVFSFTIPRTEWAGEGTRVAAADYASYVQTIGGHEHVVGLAYAQDTDAATMLYDSLVVIVGTPDGDNTAEVQLDMRQLNTPGAFSKIDATYNHLAAVAALS